MTRFIVLASRSAGFWRVGCWAAFWLSLLAYAVASLCLDQPPLGCVADRVALWWIVAPAFLIPPSVFFLLSARNLRMAPGKWILPLIVQGFAILWLAICPAVAPCRWVNAYNVRWGSAEHVSAQVEYAGRSCKTVKGFSSCHDISLIDWASGGVYLGGDDRQAVIGLEGHIVALSYRSSGLGTTLESVADLGERPVREPPRLPAGQYVLDCLHEPQNPYCRQ